MNDREILIGLIAEAKREDPEEGSFTDFLADYLLKKGIFVLPCKINQTLYVLIGNDISEYKALKIEFNVFDEVYIRLFNPRLPNRLVTPDDFGKTVFKTREEAEKALKERYEK